MADAKKCDRCGILYDPTDIDKYQRKRYQYTVLYNPIDKRNDRAYTLDLCSGCQCMLSNFLWREPLDTDLIAHASKDYVADYVNNKEV